MDIPLKIDVEGLSITITSAGADSTDEASKSKVKGKSKAKAAGKELISDAHLRLKGGVHYGLLGRNGTGKSSKSRHPTNIDPCINSQCQHSYEQWPIN